MNLSELNHTLQPVLIPGAGGNLIGFYHPPAAGVVPRGDVLVVPAFAEEMNRCRSMVTLQAQAFAALGMGTLVLDMRGTGDSAGEFSDGTVEDWCADLRLGQDWLRHNGHGCRTLLGVRLGGLIAAHLAAQDGLIKQLILWMPVVSGKQFLTQFLRIRIAADMSLSNGIRSTEQMRKQSARGEVVESSGYLIGPRLAQQLDEMQMPSAAQMAGKSVLWFEVSASADSPFPRTQEMQMQAWRDGGVPVEFAGMVGPQFWHVHERMVAPALIDACTAAIAARPAAPLPVPMLSAQPLASADLTTAAEYPVAFRCGQDVLSGIIHRGAAGPSQALGMVIVVAGGPQFRVGAHRQFVSLARLVAAKGYPVMRFDLRGMGDASGTHVGYEESVPDIRAAIDEFFRREPQLQQVALFGECNSASGILFYAYQDKRVRQIALANPWVRTSDVQAEAILKHYYLDRLRSRAFWINVARGKFKIWQSATSFVGLVRTYLRGRQARQAVPGSTVADIKHLPLTLRTADGLRRFGGPILLLMSGRDLIAREFDDVTKSAKAWAGLLDHARISRRDIADADHTFSKPEAKAEAQQALLTWLDCGKA